MLHYEGIIARKKQGEGWVWCTKRKGEKSGWSGKEVSLGVEKKPET